MLSPTSNVPPIYAEVICSGDSHTAPTTTVMSFCVKSCCALAHTAGYNYMRPLFVEQARHESRHTSGHRVLTPIVSLSIVLMPLLAFRLAPHS